MLIAADWWRCCTFVCVRFFWTQGIVSVDRQCLKAEKWGFLPTASSRDFKLSRQRSWISLRPSSPHCCFVSNSERLHRSCASQRRVSNIGEPNFKILFGFKNEYIRIEGARARMKAFPSRWRGLDLLYTKLSKCQRHAHEHTRLIGLGVTYAGIATTMYGVSIL